MQTNPLTWLLNKLTKTGPNQTGSQSRRIRTIGKAMPTSRKRLQHMKSLGFKPRVIFDCGAYLGHWTKSMAQVFPGAQIVLMEPNATILPKTRQTIAGITPAPRLLDAACGAQAGVADLNVWGNEHTSVAGSSMLGHVQGDPQARLQVRVETIDSIAEQTGFKPDLLKLDLQGAELPALQGAESVLETAELVICEFGCLEAYLDRTTPRDVMNHLYDRDFALYDIVDLIYRPYDGALTSGDLFFIKNSSPLRQHKGFL